MSRASALARGQVAALAGMTDACTIRRVTGSTFNRTTGQNVPTYLSPDPYSGKCRVQQHQATADRQDTSENQVLMLRVEVQLPMSVVGLQVADEVTVTASGDADLVGRTFRIHDLAHKTEATARRVQCVERTG